MTDSVFVTGATGIVGAAVTRSLLAHGANVIAAVRNDADAERLPAGVQTRLFDYGMTPTEMDIVLDGCDRLLDGLTIALKSCACSTLPGPLTAARVSSRRRLHMA